MAGVAVVFVRRMSPVVDSECGFCSLSADYKECQDCHGMELVCVSLCTHLSHFTVPISLISLSTSLSIALFNSTVFRQH